MRDYLRLFWLGPINNFNMASVPFLQNFQVLEIKFITKIPKTTSDLRDPSPNVTIMKFGGQRCYIKSTIFHIFICLGCSSLSLVYSCHL